MLSSSEASIQISQCGYRSEPPVPSCSSSRLGRKVAVHKDCDVVNMFLSSTSQRRVGLPHQISRCTFQRDRVEFTRLAHSLGQVFRCFSRTQPVLAKYASFIQANLYLVASSLFRIGLRLQSSTSLSCSFSRGVLTALVFVLPPDSLTMGGACLRSGSMSRSCPV